MRQMKLIFGFHQDEQVHLRHACIAFQASRAGINYDVTCSLCCLSQSKVMDLFQARTDDRQQRFCLSVSPCSFSWQEHRLAFVFFFSPKQINEKFMYDWPRTVGGTRYAC